MLGELNSLNNMFILPGRYYRPISLNFDLNSALVGTFKLELQLAQVSNTLAIMRARKNFSVVMQIRYEFREIFVSCAANDLLCLLEALH